MRLIPSPLPVLSPLRINIDTTLDFIMTPDSANVASTRSDQARGSDPSGQGLDGGKPNRGVLRTAWILGGIALAIYIAFVLSGVLRA